MPMVSYTEAWQGSKYDVNVICHCMIADNNYPEVQHQSVTIKLLIISLYGSIVKLLFIELKFKSFILITIEYTQYIK